MPVPSRPFFDLSAVSQLSRALRRAAAPSERPLRPAATVEPPAAPAPRTLAEPPALGPFHKPEVRYAEELWLALLGWIREGLGARGVFALDMRGFFIAGVGDTSSVPAEVLMASFTSVAQLLEAYLSSDRPLSELLIVAEQEPPVTVFTVPWEKEGIFVGLYGGRSPSEQELEYLRQTIHEELGGFASEPATH
ncbi:MAG: hypothetical protein GXP47_01345 [Acidobacteria bacterium]|nr:hypothetical protein [Acidobacteriota bacterium]